MDNSLSWAEQIEMVWGKFINLAIQQGPQKQLFFPPRFKSSNGCKLLAYQGSKLWIDLPIKLKDQSHLWMFQVELKDN